MLGEQEIDGLSFSIQLRQLCNRLLQLLPFILDSNQLLFKKLNSGHLAHRAPRVVNGNIYTRYIDAVKPLRTDYVALVCLGRYGTLGHSTVQLQGSCSGSLWWV